MKISAATMRVVGFVGALLGVAACGTLPAYQDVAAGQPAVEMKLIKSYGATGFAESASQGYSLSTDETCKTASNAAGFSMLTGNEKVVRIVPDKPVLVWASTMYAHGYDTKSCLSVARFTPQSGHAYDVSQPTTTSSPGCRVTIIDRATGAPAPGMEFVKASPCGEESKAAKG